MLSVAAKIPLLSFGNNHPTLERNPVIFLALYQKQFHFRKMRCRHLRCSSLISVQHIQTSTYDLDWKAHKDAL